MDTPTSSSTQRFPHTTNRNGTTRHCTTDFGKIKAALTAQKTEACLAFAVYFSPKKHASDATL